MNPAPTLGLIINTSNQPEYLARVLKGVSNQTSPPDQVVVAEDGNDEPTRVAFEAWERNSSIARVHVSQEHQGFRRARILNQAIARSTCQYLVFLDGDTVPHPEFIGDHRKLARAGAFIQGHRALIGQNASAWFGLQNFNAERTRAFWRGQIQGLKHSYRWPSPLRRARSGLRGIRGCNLAIWRVHLLKANGYNEAFTGWGREDSELAVRLMNAGVKRVDVRGWALCFHLWHPPASRSSLTTNDDLLAQAQNTHAVRCAMGLDQYLPIPRA